MERSASQTPTELLQRLHQNDEQALACLMKSYYNDLYNYAWRFAQDDAMIKDCIQEVFISLWQRRDTATDILSPKFYLLRAVKNKVLKSLHKNDRNAVITNSEYNFLEEFTIEKFIIEKQISEEKAARLRKTMLSLSRRQKEVIHLKFYLHLDHAQIAELMNISRQSVYNLLHESIQKLRGLWHSEFVHSS